MMIRYVGVHALGARIVTPSGAELTVPLGGAVDVTAPHAASLLTQADNWQLADVASPVPAPGGATVPRKATRKAKGDDV